MAACVYMKQRESTQDGQAVFFDVQKHLLTLTMWPGRPQMQKESCKPLTMMMRGKDVIGTSMLHFTMNSNHGQSYRLWL